MDRVIKMIIETLAEYGAELGSDSVIVKNGKETGIRILQIRGRLRFESCATGALRMSGSPKPETVRNFVEKFWFWTKQHTEAK
jgi:hypothetical protein